VDPGASPAFPGIPPPILSKRWSMSGLSVSPEAEERRCQEPGCRVEGTLVDAQSLFCFTHDPDKEKERIRARRRAGESTARKYRRLDPDDFGPLECPADAQRWAAMVARALLGGQLSAAKASAIKSLLAEWRSAHSAGEVRARLERLEAETQRRMGMVR
jgi:hypothetical protein